MQESPYDYVAKIIFVGPSGVGKSNICSRFTRNSFNLQTKSTIGVEFGAREIIIDDNVIKIQLWDTAGQEKFHSVTQGFYRNAAGVFLVYEISKQESFDEIPRWLSECKKSVSQHTQFLLLGNKIDLTHTREVSKFAAKSYADLNGMLFMECSALTGEGIEEALSLLTCQIYNAMIKNEIQFDNPLSEKKDSICIKAQKKNKWYCCFLH